MFLEGLGGGVIAEVLKYISVASATGVGNKYTPIDAFGQYQNGLIGERTNFNLGNQWGAFGANYAVGGIYENQPVMVPSPGQIFSLASGTRTLRLANTKGQGQTWQSTLPLLSAGFYMVDFSGLQFAADATYTLGPLLPGCLLLRNGAPPVSFFVMAARAPSFLRPSRRTTIHPSGRPEKQAKSGRLGDKSRRSEDPTAVRSSAVIDPS